ncbi:MAG: porin [Muribaculaceae bacterium]|nr:porin [Muribaculaceae bacterium]MDE6532096.1 porin [Muribaculaceae bacterium]
MKKTSLLPLLLLPFASYAQSEYPEVRTFRILEFNDSTDYVITLHENAPRLINTPDVPRFALLGKEGKFYLGLGANIKATANYDLGNPVSNPNLFVTSAIPMTKAPGNGGQFQFSAQQSNIYLNVVALPGTKDQLGAYVSFNFLGDNYTPFLQHAYLKYRGITAGYTYSLFTDAAAGPATIDYEGPNAFTAVIHGMVGYEASFGYKKGWKAGIGLDMPNNSFTNATHTATVTQRVPDIPFYIQRNWANGNGWLRLSGIIRNLYYRNETAQKNIDKVGWGVKASGTTPIYGGLSAYYQAVYGEGIASYIQDLTGCGMDLMPDPSDPSAMNPVKAWAAFGSLQYNFTPKFFCTATYSQVRTYADRYGDSSVPWKTGYKYAQYILANAFYNVSPIVQVGLEYIYGRRVDFGGSQAHDNRLEAMLQVSF